MTEVTGPSIKQVKDFIKNKDTIEVCCIDGTKFLGTIKWVDTFAICLETKKDGMVTINLHALNWYKKILEMHG